MKFLSLVVLSGFLSVSCASKKSCCSKDHCDKPQKAAVSCCQTECKGDSCEMHKQGKCQDNCAGSCHKKK